MKIGRYLGHGHTPAIKGDVYGGQKWLTALKIHIQEELKKKEKNKRGEGADSPPPLIKEA